MDPNNTPALDPPLGTQSNFVDPYTLQPILIAISVVALSLCTISIAARSYTRAIIFKKFELDDYALLLAGTLFAVFTAIQIVAGGHGQGKHQWNVTEADFSRLLLDLNVIEILYGPSMFFAKYVVLRQIEKIFLQHRPLITYRFIWSLIWVNLIFYGAIAISFILACVPRNKIWDPTVRGICIDSNASIIATSAINVVSDFTILIVPISGIWQLQLPLMRKLGVAAVFAVGILYSALAASSNRLTDPRANMRCSANVSSIIRLYYSVQLTKSNDVTWAIEPVACWALAEFTTVILVACFPSFPRFVSHLRKRDPESKTRSYFYSNTVKGSNRNAHRFQALELRDTSSTTELE